MRKGWGMGVVVAVVIAGVAAPRAAAGQVALSAAAGAASYDLSGVGTSGVAAVRVEAPVLPWVDVQAGTGFFWYPSQAVDDRAMLLPEAGLMVRLPALPLYLGAGVGHTLGVKGEQDDEPTLYAALGADLEDRGGWAIRPEIRLRAVDPWVGTIADFTLGVRRRFGP